jgi:hypothetical protein
VVDQRRKHKGSSRERSASQIVVTHFASQHFVAHL